MPFCPECEQPLPPEQTRFCPACGVPLAPPPDLQPGQIVAGRFRIVRLLAEGGMGRVYLAEQTLGAAVRAVALKMMLPDSSANPVLVARFQRECALLTELEHPNTVKVYDFGQTEEGELFIAMERVPGESLASALEREGGFSVERTDGIVAQIAGSLDEAHQKGIVHRDLKPANVLLGQHAGALDFVKVLDFGIAKRTAAATPGESPTMRGAVVGSMGYMSPEQLAGARVDARTDVYTLGVLTYEMLVGRPPFVSGNALEMVTMHLSAEPAPFATTPRGARVPEAVRRAVLRALAKSPDDRPASALAFYEEMRIAPPTTRRPSLGAPPSAHVLVHEPDSLRSGDPGPRLAPTIADAPGSVSAPPSVHEQPPPARGVPSGSAVRTLVLVLIGAAVALLLLAAGMWLHHALEEDEHPRAIAPLPGR